MFPHKFVAGKTNFTLIYMTFPSLHSILVLKTLMPGLSQAGNDRPLVFLLACVPSTPQASILRPVFSLCILGFSGKRPPSCAPLHLHFPSGSRICIGSETFPELTAAWTHHLWYSADNNLASDCQPRSRLSPAEQCGPVLTKF